MKTKKRNISGKGIVKIIIFIVTMAIASSLIVCGIDGFENFFTIFISIIGLEIGIGILFTVLIKLAMFMEDIC